MITGLIYLATPYSKAYPESPRHEALPHAHRGACIIAARMIARGFKVYSPIAHTHPIAEHGKLNPLDHDLWMNLDAALMDRSDVLVVVQMRGWNKSKGVKMEIDAFKSAGKPIFYLDPQDRSLTLRETP